MRTRTPCSPVAGFSIASGASAATPCWTTAPRDHTTSASGNAARIPSSGDTTDAGTTVALPPPCVRACTALSPMTATRRTVSGATGSRPSLRTSTIPSTAVSRATARPSTSAGGAGGSNPSRAPTRAARPRTRSTLRSTCPSSIRPSRTAATSSSPHGPSGPGITRSCAATAASSERTAVQSLTTTPSNPHSLFSGVSSRSCSDMVVPLTEL